MECNEDIRVKLEPNNIWPDANEIFDSVDSCEVKNFENYPIDKSSENMALQKKLDEQILLDFECKYVKLERKPLSKTICKTEYQSYSPIVKVEDPNQISIFDKKSLIILIKKGFDYHNNCQFKVNSPLKIDKFKKVKIFGKNTLGKLSYECKTCRKTYKVKSKFKRNINTAHEDIRSYKCKICHKSFRQKSNFASQTNSFHNRSKPFEWESCHKLFLQKSHLESHLNTGNHRENPFECDNCHQPFGGKSKLSVSASVNSVQQAKKEINRNGTLKYTDEETKCVIEFLLQHKDNRSGKSTIKMKKLQESYPLLKNRSVHSLLTYIESLKKAPKKKLLKFTTEAGYRLIKSKNQK